MGIRVDMGYNSDLSSQGDIVSDEDIFRIGIVYTAILADIDILADVDSPSPMHPDPPGIEWTKEGHPVQENVPDLPANEAELAHFPPFAGMLDCLGKIGSVIEIWDLHGRRDGGHLIGHYFQYCFTILLYRVAITLLFFAISLTRLRKNSRKCRKLHKDRLSVHKVWARINDCSGNRPFRTASITSSVRWKVKEKALSTLSRTANFPPSQA